MRPGRSGAWLIALLAASGCPGAEERRAADQRSRSEVQGEVVARVDGAPIGSEEVREVAQGAGLSPRESLSRLEDERLLVELARARGYAQSWAVEREGRRMMVQALLARTVERSVRPEGIPVSEVRARFDQVAAQRGLDPSTFAEHEPKVRAQLVVERRAQALDELLDRLRKRYRVELSEERVDKLLGDPRLWGDGA